MAAKRECTITRQEFREQAAELHEIRIADNAVLRARKKEFSTKSLGWYESAKVFLPLGENGKLVECQAQVTITLIGSKELPN